MSRAFPLSHSISAVVALALSGAVGPACTSDDLIAALTEVVPDTTGEYTTMPPEFTTGEPEDTTGTTAEVPDTPESCQGALDCLGQCALALPADPPPEQDYGCFEPCVDELTTEEWLALFALGQCVFKHCNSTAECPDVGEEQTCLNCVVLTVVNPALGGCEVEDMACK